MIFVYHKNREDIYNLVAYVETDDLEKAYYLTNHVERNWTENEGVTLRTEMPVRSSMVGDLFFNVETAEFYVVDVVGFTLFKDYVSTTRPTAFDLFGPLLGL